MANLKDVKIDGKTTIDTNANIKINEQCSLKDKNNQDILNSDGHWMKSSLTYQGDSLSVDVVSAQNSALDIKNTGQGNAGLKVNGVEIVDTNSIVKASIIEDKFLRNDQNDSTTGSLTAQKFIPSPGITEYRDSKITFNGSEFAIESNYIDPSYIHILGSEMPVGLMVNDVEIVSAESLKVNADAIEDRFLRNDLSDVTMGELTAQGGLVAGSSSNKIWVVKKVCDGILSDYTGATIGDKGEFLQFTSALPVLYIPIDANPGSIITRIRCRFYAFENGIDILAYSIRRQREDDTLCSSEYLGDQEWRNLTTQDAECMDIYDIQDFTIQANYKYWFEIKAPSVSNSVKIYSIAYEMSVRKY